MANLKHEFDIIVLGAGLVGVAAAIALRLQGYRVALLEHGKIGVVLDSGWDSRIYAISPGNAAWLEKLGIWDELDASRICAVEGMRIWGDQGAVLELDAYAANLASLSLIVEGNRLQHALLARLETLDISVVGELTIEQVVKYADGYALQTADGEYYSASLLVGADGASSWLRTQTDITVKRHDYAQMGVVANFACEHSHLSQACQWFHGDDVLAWLPLPQQHISMVWSVDNARAQALLALDAETLAQQVAAAGQSRLGRLKLVTPAQAFPLAMQVPDSLIQPGLALVGDAAHQVHPLAGQGVNLGFRDVQALVEAIGEPQSRRKPGELLVLRRYERARKADMMSMCLLTHGLSSLYAHPAPWSRMLRNQGMQQLNRMSALKKKLIQQAII
ncbi:FAD-dependent monooxygenase [Methylobacillus arboreus]|uniref:FAD-dependent monooxygenase n=1 Tax=Methylobacillus arboreus TaxID=755170 RepID=UPI001E5179E7|nr:FAD-dependent monooxygenase [Methylobacillus arboreus]MCB5190352.1 FAD-dependent monooxygenase [Methylobacillus arboreus]